MATKFVFIVTLLSALGCGVIGGVFFAFSTFVMKALEALRPPHGIAAMKSINVVVLNPVFLGMFLGTAASCIVLILTSLLAWETPGAALALVGAILYLVGTFLVTLICNVPRNDALAPLHPSAQRCADAGSEYVRVWTAWNHVRTISGVAASVLMMIALWFSTLRHPV